MVIRNSWGRIGNPKHNITFINDPGKIREIMAKEKAGLPYGVGRSYGDVCLNPDGNLWDMTGLDHFISFNEKTGRLRCEAGVLLRDIQQLMVPRGWMLPVTPGTLIVTVGGAIANDVHGKSHHVHGSFGDHVCKITLLRTTGESIECGPDIEPQWFAATIGGIGLTGVIVEAELQLQRINTQWIEAETIPFSSLKEFEAINDESGSNWDYTVSWVDCLHSGRGLYMRGNSSSIENGKIPISRTLTMPITPPFSLVNKFSLNLFNNAYYLINSRKKGVVQTHYEKFFYPLDNLLEWNRMYGRHGFFQYQSVVPKEGGIVVIDEMLKVIEKSGEGSFLGVLKTFGNRKAPGLMSFPRSGITLALDFPNKKEKTQRLFTQLNAIVSEAGGVLYLAKDACMPKEMFLRGYPQLDEFLKYRDVGICSAMSKRLIG